MVSARMGSVPRPLRLAYEGVIARAADPLGRGLSSRELFQAGIELIGSSDRSADLEVLSKDPWNQGWLIRIRPSSKTLDSKLMDAAAYERFLAEKKH